MADPKTTVVPQTKGLAVPTKSKSEQEREARLNGKTLPAAGPVKSATGGVMPAGYSPGHNPNSMQTQFKAPEKRAYPTTKWTATGSVKTEVDGTVIETVRAPHGGGEHITTTLPDGSVTTTFRAYGNVKKEKGKPATGGTTMGYTSSYKPDPKHAEDYRPHLKEITKAFDAEALRRCCTMGETEFAAVYAMSEQHFEKNKDHEAGFYAFKDNGADILFVAHLDTVSPPEQRMCNYVNTAAGPMVWSRSLDDRLGAYIGLELLPKLGMTFDWLLTTNEEIGDSTAFEFNHPEGKEYNWIIEFDRGGTDVVMYQFEDAATRKMVTDVGAKVGNGSCSDISYLADLRRKAFNWGTGYMQYHTTKSHAYLMDTFKMVGLFMDFYAAHGETVLEHTAAPPKYGKWSRFGDAGGDRPTYDYAGSHAGAWWDDLMRHGID